jgi:hypothetical protein
MDADMDASLTQGDGMKFDQKNTTARTDSQTPLTTEALLCTLLIEKLDNSLQKLSGRGLDLF